MSGKKFFGEAVVRSLSRFVVVGFLLIPFFVILLFERAWSLPTWEEMGRAFVGTLFQASMSAGLSLIFGLAGAMGLLRLKANRRGVELLLLLPNFLPPLFVILAALNVIRPFPFGWFGVVLLHVIMNAGLAAVVLENILISKVGGLAELAWIEGASHWRFLFDGVIRGIRAELLALGFGIFVLCFSSFAIPVIVGGGQISTLDLLLYEKIRIEGNWSQAAGLAVLQTLSLLLLGWALQSHQVEKGESPRRMAILESRWGLLPVLLGSVGLLVGLFRGAIVGITNWMAVPQALPLLVRATLGSLFVGLVTGGVCWMGLSAIARGWPHPRFKQFLFGYSSPSVVLTAFGFLLVTLRLGVTDTSMKLLFVAVAIGIPTLPALFRMRWGAALESLEGQLAVAQTLGASPYQIYSRILMPQLRGARGLLCGLAAFWAIGEFALSGILAGNDSTLALVVQGLLGSYRLEMATALVWWMLLVGGTCYFLFRGFRRVTD